MTEDPYQSLIFWKMSLDSTPHYDFIILKDAMHKKPQKQLYVQDSWAVQDS